MDYSATFSAFLIGFTTASSLWITGLVFWSSAKRSKELSAYTTTVPCPCGGREVFRFQPEKFSYEHSPDGTPRWRSQYHSFCRSCEMSRSGYYEHTKDGPPITKVLAGDNPQEVLPTSYPPVNEGSLMIH